MKYRPLYYSSLVFSLIPCKCAMNCITAQSFQLFLYYLLTLLRTLAWRIWNQSVMTSLILDLKTFRFSLQKQVTVAFPTLQKYTGVLIALNMWIFWNVCICFSRSYNRILISSWLSRIYCKKLFKLSPNSTIIAWLFSSKNVVFFLSKLPGNFIFLGEDWQTARKDVKSKMHILDPMGIDMKLQKALNPDDIRLAQ